MTNKDAAWVNTISSRIDNERTITILNGPRGAFPVTSTPAGENIGAFGNGEDVVWMIQAITYRIGKNVPEVTEQMERLIELIHKNSEQF